MSSSSVSKTDKWLEKIHFKNEPPKDKPTVITSVCIRKIAQRKSNPVVTHQNYSLK
jgi:hypothetical protein